MKSFFLFLFVFFSVTQTSFSQQKIDRILLFEISFKKLQKENKKDSLFILIDGMEKNPNLSSLEQQAVYFYKGLYYKNLSKHKVAISLFLKSLKYKNDTPFSKKIVVTTFYHLSDSFFTIQDFDKANFYGNIAIKNLKLDNENHSKYIDLHSIIGFFEFRQTNYKKSISEYNLALNAAKKFNPCKISEVKNKIAKIYSKQNQFSQAVITINEGLAIADSCQEKINKVNCLRSYRDILLENNKIEKANEVYSEIETLLIDIEARENLSRFDSLEIAYRTKFKDQENRTLKILNIQKESLLEKQKWALIFTILGIILLASLLFYLNKLSNEQKKSNIELEKNKIKIEENNKQLIRLNVLNQKIFSVISHDFKAPITTLQLLLSKEEITKSENPIVASYIQEISHQLDQSDAMLQSLLDWAKTELLFAEHSEEITNVYNCFIMVKNQLIKNIQEKNCTIKVQFEKDLKVQFPSAILNIVLRNVINNAIKFSPENSIIEVFFEHNTLKIKDYGVGIGDKKINKLFKRNVNPGLGTNYETGFGMGMYLSSELMQKYKGSISVISNMGNVGSTFSIHLS